MGVPLESELIVARFQTYRADLVQVLGRLSDDLLDWAPAKGMRTVGGQLAEILATEEYLVSRLRGETLQPYTDRYRELATLGSMDAYRQRFRETREDTLCYLASLGEADLAEPVALPPEIFESLHLPVVPRGEVFRSMVQHEWYHVGQLTSYLWMRGDNPYEWEG